MSLSTGPYSIVGGQTLRISLPPATLLARAVVIGNTTAAAITVQIGGSTRIVLPGSADLFYISSGQGTVTVMSLGPAGTKVGTLHVTWYTPAEIPQSGYPLSASRVSYTTVTTKIYTVTIIPVVKTVGVFTGRRTLAGTTTPVAIIPTTRSESYFSNLRIGWSVWGDVANTGTYIYIGDSAGGDPPDWARIPAGSTKLIGRFSVAWGDAWVARVAGKSGDVVNVWAA